MQTIIAFYTEDTEIVFVRINVAAIIGCYYCPQSDTDFTTLTSALEFITGRYPNDHNMLVGDMNLPGIDWRTETVRPHTANKQLHYDFMMMMKLHGFSQLIQSPTHIHGNTLDLICSNRPELIYEHDVVSLSLSDHSIITAAIEMESTRPGATTRVI